MDASTQVQMEQGTMAGMDLKGMLPQELEDLVASMGEKAFRARQLQAWLYARGVSDLDAMTDLPKSFRRELAAFAHISQLRCVVRQEAESGRAVKFLFATAQGDRFECVLIMDGARRTVCLSSQVGCPVGCRFCATARMGFRRQLGAGEIIDQLLQVSAYLRGRDERISNVVMMGMGEPLLNYDAVVRAVRLMRLELGPGIGGRRITVSTFGHLAGIRRLMREELNVGLAISLNATTDAQRQQLMPATRSHTIAELLEAARAFYDAGRRRVTFEYVLLAGVNDDLEDARRLAALSRRVPCKLNLIPYNEIGAKVPYRRPTRGQITAFRQLLESTSPVPVTVRESEGRDIDAACGQLFQRQEDHAAG